MYYERVDTHRKTVIKVYEDYIIIKVLSFSILNFLFFP
jgi:hypothetical protein